MESLGFLVVGKDSLVGGGLLRALLGRGHRVFATTRRVDTLNQNTVFLDFESDERFVVPAGVDYVFLVAATTNYERCENDPNAHRINVERIPRVAESILAQGAFLTFISTNSVFGGEQPWPHENDPHSPEIAYAKQKSEGEGRIQESARKLGASERLNIVRLTKILEPNTSPLPSWINAWSRGERVQPFSDLVFAPMSVGFAGQALATIGERRISGNLHLSGADNVSYTQFAHELAEQLGVSSSLIFPTTATEKGVEIAFKPRYSGLGMKRTSELTGLAPQRLVDVVRELVTQAGEDFR